MKKKISILLLLSASYLCAVFSQNITDGFVKRKGAAFSVNGKPYYYIGTNYWQGGLLCADAFGEAGRQRVKRELSFLVKQGVTNLRVVAGAEGTGQIGGYYRVGPALQTQKGVFSEAALKGLDYLLNEMHKLNMKAVLYLSNNWDWSGGFPQYLNWNGLLADSVLLSKQSWDDLRNTSSQFYGCSPCVADYLSQVKKIISRENSISHISYSDEPAIMAWELANEPRPMRPSANDAYVAWIKKTTSLIRSLDHHHLITIGTEGQASTDDDIQLYKKIHGDKNVDYLTIHVWPKNWSYFKDTSIAAGMSKIVSRSVDYINKHVVIATSLNKPLVIEEFGLPRDLQSFEPASPALLRQQYYNVMFSLAKKNILSKGCIAGINFWAFGGEGRPIKGQPFWKEGDTYLGDPPMEEQGLNAVFDVDAPIWKIVRSYTGKAPFK